MSRRIYFNDSRWRDIQITKASVSFSPFGMFSVPEFRNILPIIRGQSRRDICEENVHIDL